MIPIQETGFFHTVFFWLHDDAPASDAEKIAAGCRKHLAGIPGVLRLSVGVPAGTDRLVVDNSYGLALLVEFAGKAEHDAYQVHPDHATFIDECSRYWARVQVYDTLPLNRVG